MKTIRLGIIMNGVTGRMGTNQHLVRSINAIRAQGGVALADGRRDHARPDPRRPQRGQARGARAGARRRALDHRPRRRARQPATTRSTSTRASTGLRPELIRKAIAAGKHIYTEKPIAPTLAEALDLYRRARGRRREARRRAGQALAARPAQAEDADRLGLLRPHPVGARRVRLLGVRGRLAAGAAAVVELPQGGRRRHHRRHAVPLALRARQPVRRGEERDRASAPRTSRSAGTRAASRTTRPPTTPRTRRSSSTDGVIAQFNSSWCTRVRRDDLVTFHVDGTLGSAVAGLTDCRDPAARGDAEAGVESRRAADDRLLRHLADSCRRTATYDNAFKVEWELFLRHVVDGGPFRWNLLEGAKGVQLAELGLAELARAALRRRAGARRSDACAMTTLKLPHRRRHARRRSRCAPPRRGRVPRGAPRAGIASPSPPRTSSPIRAPRSIRGSTSAVDWDATLAFRRHLWSLGFGVAEAMDTAQRGMGLDWPTSLELIRRSRRTKRAAFPGAVVFSGAGTDHLPPGSDLHARRRDRRLRRAMRRDRSRGRPHHPDGEPRARRLRPLARRLRAGLRPRALAGARAGDPALAGRDVRSGARRLLGRRRRPRERSRPRARHGRLRRR